MCVYACMHTYTIDSTIELLAQILWRVGYQFSLWNKHIVRMNSSLKEEKDYIFCHFQLCQIGAQECLPRCFLRYRSFQSRALGCVYGIDWEPSTMRENRHYKRRMCHGQENLVFRRRTVNSITCRYAS